MVILIQVFLKQVITRWFHQCYTMEFNVQDWTTKV